MLFPFRCTQNRDVAAQKDEDTKVTAAEIQKLIDVANAKIDIAAWRENAIYELEKHAAKREEAVAMAEMAIKKSWSYVAFVFAGGIVVALLCMVRVR